MHGQQNKCPHILKNCFSMTKCAIHVYTSTDCLCIQTNFYASISKFLQPTSHNGEWRPAIKWCRNLLAGRNLQYWRSSYHLLIQCWKNGEKFKKSLKSSPWTFKCPVRHFYVTANNFFKIWGGVKQTPDRNKPPTFISFVFKTLFVQVS